MNKILNKITDVLGDKLYKIAYFILMFAFVFTNVYQVHDYVTIIKTVAYILFLINGLLNINKYNVITIIRISLIAFCMGVSTYISFYSHIIDCFAVVLASYNIKFKDFIKYDLIIKSIMLVILFFLNQKGLCIDYGEVVRNNLIRYSFGLGHPNKFAAYTFSIMLEIIYLFYEKIKFYIFPIILIFTFLTYYYTGSRTFVFGSIIITLLLFVMFICGKYNFYKLYLFRFLFLITLPVCIVLSLYAVYSYDGNDTDFWLYNKTISGRIALMSQALKEYKIKPFGTRIAFTYRSDLEPGKSLFVIDNSYVHVLLNYGYLMLIIYVIYISKGFLVMFKKSDYLCAIIMITMIFYGLSETYFFKMPTNPFLLIMGYGIVNKKDTFY